MLCGLGQNHHRRRVTFPQVGATSRCNGGSTGHPHRVDHADLGESRQAVRQTHDQCVRGLAYVGHMMDAEDELVT